MAVIVVSETLGSGGNEIAKRVAQRLEVPLLDREVIGRIANKAGVTERSILNAERTPSLWERTADLLGFYPLSYILGLPMSSPPPALRAEWYRDLVEELIRGSVDGGVMILGHAAQAMLKGNPHAFRVLVCAPLTISIQRLVFSEGLSLGEAERRVRKSHHDLEQYARLYCQEKWFLPDLYDLVINTEKLGVEASIKTILEAAGKAHWCWGITYRANRCSKKSLATR